MDQPESPPESPAGPDPVEAPPEPAPARPTIVPAPVRSSRPEPVLPRDAPRAIEVPSRSIQVNGEEWIVSEGGRTSSGRGNDSRAHLLLLLFAHAAEPDRPVRETLSTVPGLDELGDEELGELLGRARAYRVVQERSEVFPDTRKKGQKGF